MASRKSSDRDYFSNTPGDNPSNLQSRIQDIDGIFTSHTLQPLCCAFLPFGEYPSDHRALWIDLSFDNFFGYKMPKLVVPKAQRLKTDDPRVTKKWIDSYKGLIKDNNLHQRMFEIEQNMMLPLPQDLACKYDNILAQHRQGFDYADKRCRKLRMRCSTPCSPVLTKAGIAIELWKAVITKKTGCKYSTSKLKRLEKKVGVTNSLHHTLQEAKAKLKIAINQHKELKKNAAKLRKTFLEEKAQAIADEGTSDSANIYQQLLMREKQQEAARRIKFTLNKIDGKGITKVEIQWGPDEPIEELTTKEDIEQACMAENHLKYTHQVHTLLSRNTAQ